MCFVIRILFCDYTFHYDYVREEFQSAYSCCTFRSNVLVYDTSTPFPFASLVTRNSKLEFIYRSPINVPSGIKPPINSTCFIAWRSNVDSTGPQMSVAWLRYSGNIPVFIKLRPLSAAFEAPTCVFIFHQPKIVNSNLTTMT